MAGVISWAILGRSLPNLANKVNTNVDAVLRPLLTVEAID